MIGERRKQDKIRLANAMKKKLNLAEKAYQYRSSITVAIIASTMSVQMAFASGDIWGKVQDVTQEIYLKVLGISTGVLVMVVAIALIMRMVSKNPRSIEIWTGWAKTAAFSWAILNGLGFILGYARDLLGGGEVSGIWG